VRRKARAGCDDGSDILKVVGTMGDDLHDDQVFGVATGIRMHWMIAS